MRTFYRCLLMCVALCPSGCTVMQTPTTEISVSLPTSQAIAIVYQVEEAVAANPLRTDASNATAIYKTKTVSLKYPHPKCKPGYARVELVITSPRSGDSSHPPGLARRLSSALESVTPGVRMGEGIAEAWTIDVPRKDLDPIMEELSERGFFVAPGGAMSTGVMLAAEVNGETIAKHWQRMAALDHLANRVRKKGSLVSHTSAPIDLAALIAVPASPFTAQSPLVQQAAYSVPSAPIIERLPPVLR